VLKHANSSSQGRVALVAEASRKFLESAKREKVVFVLWTAGRVTAPLNKNEMQRTKEQAKKWVFVANTRYNYFPLMRRL
jgi:hypothetical protein